MKASFIRRYRGWVLALLLVPALTFNPVNPLIRLSAQTNAVTATNVASGTNPAPATNATPETNPAPATNAVPETTAAPAATNAAPSTNAASASTNAAAATPEIDKDSGKPIITTQSGLKYVDLDPGTGPAIKPGDEVTVSYEGRFPDGTVFDSSEKHTPPTYTFVQDVTDLIAGWKEGTSTMKVGGKRKLIIPPSLGYGADGNQAIPPNSTLIFTVTVISATPKEPAPKESTASKEPAPKESAAAKEPGK